MDKRIILEDIVCMYVYEYVCVGGKISYVSVCVCMSKKRLLEYIICMCVYVCVCMSKKRQFCVKTSHV